MSYFSREWQKCQNVRTIAPMGGTKTGIREIFGSLSLKNALQMYKRLYFSFKFLFAFDLNSVLFDLKIVMPAYFGV